MSSSLAIHAGMPVATRGGAETPQHSPVYTPMFHASPSAAAAGARSPQNPPNLVLKSGVLTKLGGGVSTSASWRTRYFVLTLRDFTYHDSAADWAAGKAPLGKLSVDASLRCISAAASDLEWKFVSTDKIVLVRGTLAEKKEWYDAITDCVSLLIAAAAAEGRTLVRGEGNSGTSSASQGCPASAASTCASLSSQSLNDVPLAGAPSHGVPFDSSGNGGSVDEEDDVDDLFTSVRESAGPDAVAAGADTPSKRRSASAHLQLSQSGSKQPISSSRDTVSALVDPSTLPASSLSASAALHELARREAQSAKARAVFGWRAGEQVIRDFSCGLEKGIMLPGRLYLSPSFVAFESSHFGGTKVCIPVSRILSACEAHQALNIPNAIKIFCRTSASGGADGSSVAAALAPIESSYFFGSFSPSGRAAALEIITSLVNQTFDPKEFHMDLTRKSVEAAMQAQQQQTGRGASSAIGSRSSAVEAELALDSSAATCEDACTVDDTELSGLASPPSKHALDFDAGDRQGMVDVTLPALDARTLFRLFLSDAALYPAELFHSSRGDTEFAASGWKEARLVAGAAAAGWSHVRDTTMRVPVPGSPESSTRVLKVQKARWENAAGAPAAAADKAAHSLLMETVSVTPDVPFGDCFQLLDEWRVTDLPSYGGCRVRITLTLQFLKSPRKLRFIKSQLLARVFAENKKFFQHHVDSMQAWMDSHQTELEAVKRAVASAHGGGGHHAHAVSLGGSNAGRQARTKLASVDYGRGGTGATPSAATSSAASTTGAAAAAAAPSATAAKAKAGGGMLSKLPAPFNSLARLGGAIAAVLLLLAMLYFALTGSGTDRGVSGADAAAAVQALAADAVSAGVAAVNNTLSAGATPLPSASVPTAAVSAAGGWMVIALLSVLFAALGGFFFRLQQLSSEVAKLRSEVKALKAAAK